MIMNVEEMVKKVNASEVFLLKSGPIRKKTPRGVDTTLAVASKFPLEQAADQLIETLGIPESARKRHSHYTLKYEGVHINLVRDYSD